MTEQERLARRLEAESLRPVPAYRSVRHEHMGNSPEQLEDLRRLVELVGDGAHVPRVRRR